MLSARGYIGQVVNLPEQLPLTGKTMKTIVKGKVYPDFSQIAIIPRFTWRLTFIKIGMLEKSRKGCSTEGAVEGGEKIASNKFNAGLARNNQFEQFTVFIQSQAGIL
jgi:hypothetical protein